MKLVRRAAWAAGLALFVLMTGVCGGHIVQRVGVYWMRTHGMPVPPGCGFCGCFDAFLLAGLGLVVSVAADRRTWRLSAVVGALLYASMCAFH